MDRLHVVGGSAAAESLRIALDADAGRRQDTVIEFPDSLDCGPLQPDDPAVRVEWWGWLTEMVLAQTGSHFAPLGELPGELAAFWEQMDSARSPVIWYGRDNVAEQSMFHKICATRPDTAFDVVEIPGAVGAQSPESLAKSLSEVRPLTRAEHDAAIRDWHTLEQQNQAFRVITCAGLSSAPADHYDAAILEAAGSEWTVIARAVGPVMADMNVGDSPLFWRVKSLVDSGALLADGNPWLPRQTKIKRANPDQ
ncbi:DUF3658 domain-containing protein [Nocardia sp. NPDC056000]|uniref:DUF3658 domain-containing protein n=1 Tax=Nocardia sp. NPDC056000 TaxID=3345674 RepID=UPI0035DCDAA8